MDVTGDDTNHVPAEPASGLDDVFRQESASLYRTLLAFTGGRADIAEEAAAEAFARAVAYPGRLRDPAAWIYRVAFRVAIDELRREARSSSAELSDTTSGPPEVAGLMEALRQLSPNQRAAVVLRHVVGLDTSEVADRMGIARATVHVHLFRARSRLAELLGEEEVD